jgi:acyl dehydratase
MHVFTTVDELAAAAGTHLGHSGWHEVPQDQIDKFADATGDHQWIHVDEEKAASGPFDGTIAHGFLTLSLIPSMLQEVYRVEGAKMVINYGADRLRFPAPAPAGSKLRAGVQVLEVDVAGNRPRVTTRVSVERDGNDKPVCVVDLVAVVVP